MTSGLVGAMSLALLFGCATTWWYRQRLRAWWLRVVQPSRPYPVGLIDLATLFVLLVVSDTAGIAWLKQRGVELGGMDRILPPSAQAVLSLGRIGAICVWLAVTAAARGSSWIDWLAEHGRHWRRDLAIGALFFVQWVPPILLLQAVLVSLVEYEHPALQQLRELGDWHELLPVLLATVITAPLLEELLFRGLLLRWLDRIVVEQPSGWSLVVGGTAADDGEDLGGAALPAGTPEGVVQRWTAIVASSVLFALMHMGNGPGGSRWGPDIVPLFLFACVLGWVTRATNRLTPAITMHVLLNGYSTLALLAAKTPT